MHGEFRKLRGDCVCYSWMMTYTALFSPGIWACICMLRTYIIYWPAAGIPVVIYMIVILHARSDIARSSSAVFAVMRAMAGQVITVVPRAISRLFEKPLLHVHVDPGARDRGI